MRERMTEAQEYYLLTGDKKAAADAVADAHQARAIIGLHNEYLARREELAGVLDDLLEAGIPQSVIERRTGISRSTIYRLRRDV